MKAGAGALDETGHVRKCLLQALAWAGYGAVHGAMISETATGFLRRCLGGAFRSYRLFFNVVAAVLLVPVVSYSMSLRRGLVVRYTLVAVGVLLFVTGGRHYRPIDVSFRADWGREPAAAEASLCAGGLGGGRGAYARAPPAGAG